VQPFGEVKERIRGIVTEKKTRELGEQKAQALSEALAKGGSLDKAHAIQVFNAHNEGVRRSVPSERLLVYEPGEGWEPLCDFLGLPVPATPYPKVNTTGDFVSRFLGT